MSRAAVLLLATVSLPGARGAPAARADGPRPRSVHELSLDIDGSTIHALCTDGARRVMLWHGDGSDAETWRPVLERLDGSVGACAFDRRGSGESGPAPAARGWYELLDELRRIQLALGFERGYVLVGHALGGLYARLYAADRPTDVAGLLLVDPAHEDMPDRVRPGMPDADWEAWREAMTRPNRDGVTEVSIGARARRAVLPDIPVTVITAAIRRDDGSWDARFLSEAAREVHESILRGVVRGRHVPAARSGHDVQRDEPGLVTREIERLLRVTAGDASGRPGAPQLRRGQ